MTFMEMHLSSSCILARIYEANPVVLINSYDVELIAINYILNSHLLFHGHTYPVHFERFT